MISPIAKALEVRLSFSFSLLEREKEKSTNTAYAAKYSHALGWVQEERFNCATIVLVVRHFGIGRELIFENLKG